jgi:DNA-binding NtrC family response regulator
LRHGVSDVPARVAQPGKTMRKLDIQIVDDDRDLAESLAEFMELGGHYVRRAHSGTEAIEQFRDSRFDLVFMDIKMPGMDGVDTLIEMKSIRPHADVVLMSGYSVQDRIDKALAVGAQQVLRKPLDLARISSILDAETARQLVLIIDDDSDFVDSVSEILKLKGHAVATASNGKEGFRQIMDKVQRDSAARDIGVVILDLRMDPMSGTALLQALDNVALALPVIIVTAYPEDESAALGQLEHSTVTALLQKPVNPDELFQAIQHAGRTLQ